MDDHVFFFKTKKEAEYFIPKIEEWQALYGLLIGKKKTQIMRLKTTDQNYRDTQVSGYDIVPMYTYLGYDLWEPDTPLEK